ncbi:dTDP-4-dehydrorhamnose 3,5-epimerase [Bradyrhizobium sp. HKCCYLS3077]|uniref:dTDP-4-dehydrorhamnose 3,5-epimerase n=1 Tax=unclassified Bradyrhizobium TaxID=2631580 RepID=UPI003EB85E9F
MHIERHGLLGILSLTPVKHGDSRGFFSEVYRRDLLSEAGLPSDLVQENHVYSAQRGVLRGLHFQRPPRAQGKLVRCIRGAILDVAVDIRIGSPTFGRHVAVELSATNWRQLWIPEGFAHGYAVLEAPCEVLYKVSDYWDPGAEHGLAWDDPDLGIDWRLGNHEVILSEKDRTHPRLCNLAPVFQLAEKSCS